MAPSAVPEYVNVCSNKMKGGQEQRSTAQHSAEHIGE